jgi:hypothetical protein
MDAGPLSARRRHLARAGIAVAAMVVALLGLAGCNGDDGAGATSESTTTSAAAAEPTSSTIEQPVGDPVPRDQLAVGDCFNTYDTIKVTTRVPCETPHDGEVFHFENHPAPFGEPYPNERELEKYARRACYARFEAFTGGLYEVSRLDIGAVTPTKEQWLDSRARYRGITCFLHDPSGEPLVGTMRGRAE